MNWNSDTVEKLNLVFHDKYKGMFSGGIHDRKNRSAIWNKYLDKYGCVVVRHDVPMSTRGRKPVTNVLLNKDILIHNFVLLINMKNDLVSNGVVVKNPDRMGQWIVVSRDMGERILAFGMI